MRRSRVSGTTRYLGLVLLTASHMDEPRNEKSNVTDLIP